MGIIIKTNKSKSFKKLMSANTRTLFTNLQAIKFKYVMPLANVMKSNLEINNKYFGEKKL